MGPGIECSDVDLCPQSHFCEKASCAALTGKCRPRPPFCPPDLVPVCGCNGVNYWNDCHRKQQGISSLAQYEQCAEPFACGAGSACPDADAACALLLPSTSSCAAVPAGVCWFAPLHCPPPTQAEGSWESCAGAAMCGGFCTAIHSGAIRRRVNSCL